MTFLLDNGAYTLKFGRSGESVQTFQNCLSRSKRELTICPSSLMGSCEILRPYDRGVLVDGDLQQKI